MSPRFGSRLVVSYAIHWRISGSPTRLSALGAPSSILLLRVASASTAVSCVRFVRLHFSPVSPGRLQRLPDKPRSSGRHVRTTAAREHLTSATIRTYRKIGCAARLLCRVLARRSLDLYVLSRGSLRAFAYSGCSPHFEVG